MPKTLFERMSALARKTEAPKARSEPSAATCIITNCRKPAPAGEPFCSKHRDK